MTSDSSSPAAADTTSRQGWTKKLRLPPSRLFGRQQPLGPGRPPPPPPPPPTPPALSSPAAHAAPKVPTKDFRSRTEGKVVGLKNYGLDKSTVFKRNQPVYLSGDMSAYATDDSKIGIQKAAPSSLHYYSSSRRVGDEKTQMTVEDMEEQARSQEIANPFHLMYLGNLAALKVMLFYLVTLETMFTTGLTVGLTYFWYSKYKDTHEEAAWSGGALDFILLSFAVISPISAAIGMAFTRRERALVTIATIRSSAYHLYLAHTLWDWNENGGRGTALAEVEWLQHGDAVLAQLIGIGDELSRFLSLPTTSRSRHRMTKAGRAEAARTTEVAYNLLESMSTQRITRLTLYSERLKKIGLPSGEISRMRQYERYLSDGIEQLRMVKMYRTPQALRSFARLFTVLLPPYYAPAFAQVAIELNSLGLGIVNGVIVALALTGLFLSLEALEDPFTAFLALDGIDVREEFEVLHFAQLIHTRTIVFPAAPPYPARRRAALMARPHQKRMISAHPSIGQLPVHQEHLQGLHVTIDTEPPSTVGFESVTTALEEGQANDNNNNGSSNRLKDIEYADTELGRPLMATHHSRDSSLIGVLVDIAMQRREASMSDDSQATSKHSNR